MILLLAVIQYAEVQPQAQHEYVVEAVYKLLRRLHQVMITDPLYDWAQVWYRRSTAGAWPCLRVEPVVQALGGHAPPSPFQP